jgi:spermidine synthase
MIEMISVDSVIAAQEDKDRQAASIEGLILNNPLMNNRTRLASTMSDSRSLEVWSYDDVNLKEPVKALFVNGYISVTTAPAGAAHAEALVHPALVAHPSPKRVLVISLSPVAIVKEALKYKSIEHISVIGSDAAAIDLIQKYLPTVNDCSFLLEELPSCMGSPVVEIIDEDVQAWLDHKSLSALFDIILVDVSIGERNWLSVEMYGDLPYGSEDAITVVSSGSAPSLFNIDTETVNSPRETLIRQGARSAANGGFGVNILVYDEVR